MERLVEDALLHWGARIGPVGVAASARAREREKRERPVVLRRRRERVKASKNWSYFYYQFHMDHAQPNLIWNHKVSSSFCFQSFAYFLSEIIFVHFFFSHRQWRINPNPA